MFDLTKRAGPRSRFYRDGLIDFRTGIPWQGSSLVVSMWSSLELVFKLREATQAPSSMLHASSFKPQAAVNLWSTMDRQTVDPADEGTHQPLAYGRIFASSSLLFLHPGQESIVNGAPVQEPRVGVPCVIIMLTSELWKA